MPLTIPDKGEAQSDILSVLYQEDIDILVDGIDGSECVLSGCAVTAQGAPNMTVAVAKGAVIAAGVLMAVAAANGTITAADASNPRLDLVVIDSSGAIAVRAGTPAASPKPPVRTAGDVALAMVLVPATDTTITDDQIVDKRVLRTQGPITVAKLTSPVTVNTTTAKTTLWSVTVPSGLLLAGRQLELEIGGSYLSNSGTPTWTFTVDYGGTTLFADATAATAADADRGAWRMRLTVTAQGNSDQDLTGVVNFQTPGTKTAPATGRGDLAVVTHVAAPFNGSAAVDSDTGDRALVISVTHSVSNVNVQTVAEFGRLVLH